MRAGNKLTFVTALLSLGLPQLASADGIVTINGAVINVKGGGVVILNNGAAGKVVVNANGVVGQDDQPQHPLSPAVEKAFTELRQMAVPVRQKYFEESMARAMAEVVKISKADDTAKAKLEVGAKKAVEQTAAAYLERLNTIVGRQLQGTDEEALAVISQLTEYVTARRPVVGLTAPEDQPVWAETIKTALTPAQYAEWDKIAGVKLRAQDEEILRYLKPNEERMKEQFKSGMETETGDIATVLSLPAERLAKLKTAATVAVTRTLDSWRDAQVKGIRSMSETDRRQLFTVQGGGYSTGTFKLVRPEQQEVWKDALKTELSADEFARLTNLNKERSSRRSQALALLLISDLDRLIGFTATERDRLLPLALKPARLLTGMNTGAEEDGDEFNGGVTNWYLQPGNFTAAALKMPEAEVRAILDPAQWARWQDYCKNRQENFYQPRVEKADPAKSDSDLEGLVNEFLHTAARDQEQRMVKSMLVRVEDATRIVKLQPDAVAQLSLAARGAVERTMGTWRNSLEEFINNNLQGVRASEFRERLAGMGNFSENISRDKSPQDQPLWKEAIKATLSTEQGELWKKELEARSAYRGRATAAMVLTELDRRRRLTTEQFQKLEPLVAKVIEDYSPDIARYLSNDWQLQSYSLLVPLTAIPAADLKAILTPAQAKLLLERDLAQVQGYWDGIKSYHAQRIQQKGTADQ